MFEKPKVDLDSQVYKGEWGRQSITGCVVWVQKNIVFNIKHAQTGLVVLTDVAQTVLELCQAKLGLHSASLSIRAPFPFPQIMITDKSASYLKEIQLGLSTNGMDITTASSFTSSDIIWAKINGSKQMYAYGVFNLTKGIYIEQIVGVTPMIKQTLGRNFQAGCYELRIAFCELIVMVKPFDGNLVYKRKYL